MAKIGTGLSKELTPEQQRKLVADANRRIANNVGFHKSFRDARRISPARANTHIVR